jgi:hypothetical protein
MLHSIFLYLLCDLFCSQYNYYITFMSYEIYCYFVLKSCMEIIWYWIFTILDLLVDSRIFFSLENIPYEWFNSFCIILLLGCYYIFISFINFFTCILHYYWYIYFFYMYIASLLIFFFLHVYCIIIHTFYYFINMFKFYF